MGRPRTWTDDDLRDAVAGCTTLAGVVRRLRLSRGGAAYVTVRTRMEQLGLSLAVPAAEDAVVGGRRGWTEDDVRDAVAVATSLNAVFTRLGLAPGGSQWLVIRSLILERGWSTAHWSMPLRRAGADEEKKAMSEFREVLARTDLTEALQSCRTKAEVIRSLGFEPTRTSYRILRAAMRTAELPAEGFEAAHEAMRRAARPRHRMRLDQILVANSTYRSVATLKRRLVDEGILAPECAFCGIDTWRGMPLSLHLDHINGIRNDHRLGNLRLLCPNCHSQTETFAGRNKGRYLRDGAP